MPTGRFKYPYPVCFKWAVQGHCEAAREEGEGYEAGLLGVFDS